MATTDSFDIASRLIAHQATDQGRLVAYITECLPPTDWAHAEALADRVRQEHGVVASTETGIDSVSGLPASLARTARAVLRDHLHPASGVDDLELAAPPRLQLTPPAQTEPLAWSQIGELHRLERQLFLQHRVVDAAA